MYVFWLFWKLRSWEKVIIYGYWPLSVYYVGQLYSFQVIRYEEMYHPLYPDGRSLYFKLTPVLLLGVTMLFLGIIKFLRKKIRVTWLIIVLTLGVLSGVISNFWGGTLLPKWIEIGKVMNNLIPVLWLFLAGGFLRRGGKEERINLVNYLSTFFKVALIIVSGLILIQTFKGSVLGLIVEQGSILPYDDGMGLPGIKRVMGIWTHANEAAFYIFTWLMAWLFLEIEKGQGFKKLLQTWLIWPIIALAVLQSRAAFLGIGLITIGMIFLNWGELNLGGWRQMRFKDMSWRQAGLGLGLLLSMALICGRFIWVIKNTGTWENNWQTRQRLVEVAKELVKNNFWWGVGEGNFIPVAFREDKSGTMKSFPESVHNGWWLILTEKGAVGFLIWIVFLVLLVGVWFKKIGQKREKGYLLILMLFSQGVIMLFHPFSNILMANLMMLVLLLANEDERLV